ncbi:hypothetical protein [Haladaptatus sp. W1]|uniref:hypothetical protein n=1 Tax=Haladaptatus sp. W1 TaxID=1897478 RepID=UPI0020C767CA|nr:hypothetical protein [Haladaptatus sp. W1]
MTSFEFALHPVGPTVLAGPVFWAADDTAAALRFYRDFVQDAPDELGTVVRLGTIPPLSVVPEELHWRPAVAINACYTGPVEEGESVLRPLREHGTPLLDLVSPKRYVAHQSGLDSTVLHGWHYYWKSTDLPELSDDLIEVLVDHAFSTKSPRSYAVLFHLGGAVSRVPGDATAYASRNAPHNININGVWRPDEDFAESETTWARALPNSNSDRTAASTRTNPCANGCRFAIVVFFDTPSMLVCSNMFSFPSKRLARRRRLEHCIGRICGIQPEGETNVQRKYPVPEGQ